MPAGCSRLPALLTVAAAHPVVAAACSEANCFWNFSLGVGSCAVCILWIPGNWLMMERLRNITTQEPAVSLFPLAVSNFKNKTKTFLWLGASGHFYFQHFSVKMPAPIFMEKKNHIHHLKLCREGNSYNNETKLPGKPLTVVSIRK